MPGSITKNVRRIWFTVAVIGFFTMLEGRFRTDVDTNLYDKLTIAENKILLLEDELKTRDIISRSNLYLLEQLKQNSFKEQTKWKHPPNYRLPLLD